MLRISGVNLPSNKRIVISLTYVYGIGKSLAEKALTQLKIDHNTKTKDLTEEQADQLRTVIEKKFNVEGDLRRQVIGNIQRLKSINCYRGLRHDKHLPARGQRTKTNARTVRGRKKITMGSGRRSEGKKV